MKSSSIKFTDNIKRRIIAGFLAPYIGDGIGLGGYSIFSADNIMWFVEDLCDQIEELYLNDPEALNDALRPILDEIFSMKISDVPCTEFIDTYGFGDASRGGNLGEVVLSAMYYWYTGNEDISNDKFLLDAIDQLENGDVAFDIFDTLLDIAFNDIILFCNSFPNKIYKIISFSFNQCLRNPIRH